MGLERHVSSPCGRTGLTTTAKNAVAAVLIAPATPGELIAAATTEGTRRSSVAINPTSAFTIRRISVARSTTHPG